MAIDILHDNSTLSTGDAIGNYNSASPANARAILRKINLSVDIATQDELISVYNDLSAMIGQSGTDWKAADVALSGALKEWALGSELSGALHNEITAETDRAETAEEAIRTDLSNNYKVTVEKQTTAESGYSATYYVMQGGSKVGDSINIPKDLIVKSAELCTVTTADEPYEGAEVGDLYIDFTINVSDATETASHIYLPVNQLVDVYTGGSTQFATVDVDANRVITTTVSADLISAAAVAEVVGTNADISTDNTVWGAKAYADQVAAQAATDLSVTITGDTLVSANTADGKALTVGATNDLTAAVANANSALQSIAKSGDYISVTSKENNSQTVSLTVADLTAETAGLAEATDVKSYVDTLVGTPLSGVNLNGSALTVTNRTVELSVQSGSANGTIAVNGSDVAVTGLGSAAYTDSDAYDAAGDAAKVQEAVKTAVSSDTAAARFDTTAADDYADIEAIIDDLVAVRRVLGRLKTLNESLTPAV